MSSRKWTPDAEVKCLDCGKNLGHVKKWVAERKGDEWDEWYCMECMTAILMDEYEEEYER